MDDEINQLSRETNFNETKVMQYHSLSKIGSGHPIPLFYNETTKRYIKLRYGQKYSDWSKIGNPSEINSYEFFEASQCNEKNFRIDDNSTSNNLDYLWWWEGFSIICLDDINSIKLAGSDVSVFS